MKESILIVDDDPNICELLKMYLDDEFIVKTVHDGNNVLQSIEHLNPDIIILDIMLPSKNGWEVCKEIRNKWDIPIIMLTAKGEEIDRILGLELGADDYVTKPFSPREMTARVKAVLRRFYQNSKDNKGILNFPGISLNANTRKVKINNICLDLTPKEFELLWLMTFSPGKVFSREMLLEQVWGYNFFGDSRAVDSQVKRLRKKLESVSTIEYIHTVWGIGYKFEVIS